MMIVSYIVLILLATLFVLLAIALQGSDKSKKTTTGLTLTFLASLLSLLLFVFSLIAINEYDTNTLYTHYGVFHFSGFAGLGLVTFLLTGGFFIANSQDTPN